jgi:hypothetical protein
MHVPLLLLTTLGAAAAGGAVVLGRRAAQRWQRKAAAAATAAAEAHFATFRAALVPLGVSDGVTGVVYEYFARRERVSGPGYPAQAEDGLWEVHLITYPEELTDVVRGLLVELGHRGDVEPPAAGELQTVRDLAVWLERRAGARARPA